MAKFKKLFLSAAMLFGICAIGGGLTSHADEGDQEPAELTENFSFAEEFDYGDGTIDAYGGANNHNIYNNNKKDTNDVTLELEQQDDLEVLKISAVTSTSQQVTINFRDNASASSLYNNPGTSMVIKLRFKTDHGREQQFRLYFGSNEVNSTAKTYTLLRMRTDGVTYQLGGGSWLTTTHNGSGTGFAVNTWHEAIFILEEKGDLTSENKSQDKIIAYVDGEKLYETNFGDGDNFNGKLTELNYNLPSSNIGADVHSYIDYIRIGEYNAPVANNPGDIDAFTNIPFSLGDVIIGENTAYLPSVLPAYDVDFAIKDSGDELEKTTSGNVTTYSIDGTDYIQYSSLTNKYTALTESELTATVTFAEMLDSFTFDVSVTENVEPIPVEEIVISQPNIVKNDSITLGVGEKYDLTQLFSAEPASADDLAVSYTVENEEVAHVTNNSILEALANGSTKLTITATGGGAEVSKEITLNVTKGQYAPLNSFTTEDQWAEGGVLAAGFESAKANNKDFAPVTVIEDPVFGYVLKFTGVGETKNGSAAHLNYHFPVSDLSANKDYKLTGWVKMEKVDGVDNRDARVDVKLIMYYHEEAPYGYPGNTELPYHVVHKAVEVGQAGNGWIYFEMPVAANLDVNDLEGRNFVGLKVEIAAWNVQGNIDSYVTHLNLVEQDSVHLSGWELTDEEGTVQEEYTLNAGSTLQLTALPVPSAAVLEAIYESSDTTIATVDENGLITVLNKAGEATITVTVGSETKTVNIIVTKSATAISGDKNSIEMTLEEFEVAQYYPVCIITVTPADSTSELEVVVANETVCKAELVPDDELGLYLSDVAAGTTTVTIFSKDNPEVKFEFTVKFKDGTLHTITYVSAHGEAPDPVDDVKALPEELPVLTLEGYAFGGWYLDADCTQAAEAGAAITEDTTLYAKWTQLFTVTYDAQGHGEAPTPVANVTALPATLPPLTVEGYAFGGWYLDADCTQAAQAGAAITANTTLYAKWIQLFTVSYDAHRD
ncbi:MAG: InlB B-repeat-containing protein [Anaeroplasmataceae bacterium]|nr:InlB B-repeat-containing protein [Anaeroplasmataceae bacterium]